jgi:hypothetical protein
MLPSLRNLKQASAAAGLHRWLWLNPFGFQDSRWELLGRELQAKEAAHAEPRHVAGSGWNDGASVIAALSRGSFGKWGRSTESEG